MERRTFVGSLPAVVLLAGCSDQSGGFSNSGNGSQTGNSTPAIPEAVNRLRSNVADRGHEVLETTVRDDQVVLTVQTVGDVDDDVRRIAGAYATVSVVIERDLRVHVEDRGLREASFEIRLNWARQFANDRITDAEYLGRIRETQTSN